MRIRPQVALGGYRVDFIVSMQLIEGALDNIKVYSKETIVECDGFQFHDATKDQACRDRQRDRFLQSTGLPVLRFAGAEIWADTFACAGGVLGFLLDAILVQREKVANFRTRKPAATERAAEALPKRIRAKT